MTGEKVIRKAVELADGWNMDEMAIVTHHVGDFSFIDDPAQWQLDALAAQLVRQVDSTDYAYVVEYKKESAVFYHLYDQKSPARSCGPDRTMNTIRAILKSGVLEID